MAEELAPGIQEMNELQGAGFQATEIEQWRTDTMQELVDAGFSAKETDDYFGEKTPDLSKTEANFKSNLAAKRAAEATSSGPAKREGTPEGGPKIEEADSFIEAIEAGFDMSVTGLIAGKPDTVLPENAEMFYRIASGVGQIAGDIPAMIAGAFVGAPAGAVVAGPAGAVIGAGAGAFAVPEGIRTALMEHYEKGDVQSFSDFWERASAVAISTLKGAVVGGATAGTGGAIGKVVAPALVKKTAQILGEVGVMTTVGAALDGRVPEPMEFVDGTILVGGLHGAVKTASKLRNMYGKTGMRPSEVVEEVKTNGHLRQEIMADNVETPGAKPQKPPEILRSGKSVLEPEVEYSPEVKATLAKIGEQTKSKGKTLKEQASQMYTDRVDKLNPANKMVEILSENPKELPAENNPYIMSRLVPGSDAKARVFFEKGTFEFGAEKKYTGESLNAIYKDVKDTQLLDAYQINLRALEKNKVGIDMGFDIEGAKKVVKDLGPEYHALAKRRTEFSNRVLDYVQAAGVISKESHAAMKKEGLAYLPFKRIAEDAAGGKKGGKAGSLKAVTGSNKNIQNPTLSIAENTVELIKLAEINNAKTKLVELAESVKDQQEIRKVKTPMQEVEVSREEVAKQLGIDVAEADVVTTYRQVYRDLAPNQFSVFKDGKRQVYETTPELAQAMNTLGGDMGSVGTAFKLMQGLTTFKKFALTFTPEFIAKNSFRDWFTGSINSGGKKGINPLDVLGAMGDIWKKNDAYYEMLKSGGAGGSFLDLNNLYLKNNVFKLQGETNFMGSVRNLVSKPIDMMRVAAELSEQSMRLAEFNKARAQGDSMAAAGFRSREITLDFQRIGAKQSAYNSITSFQNVAIQSIDKTVRTFQKDPQAFMTKGLTYITAPSVLLWMANKGDERVEEVPRWEKDLFWIIATDKWEDASPEEFEDLAQFDEAGKVTNLNTVRQDGDKLQINKGTIYRLPKPQEVGIMFGSLPERVLDKMFTDNPGAFSDFDETLLNLVTPNFVPDAISPVIEQHFNKSFFTGNAIIPNHLKEQIPEYQYVDYTSDTAKALGKMVGAFNPDLGIASPMQIDNYIQSWGGSLGKYAVQIADKSLKAAGVAADTDPAATLSDIPFVKAFVVRYPTAGARSIQDFYSTYEDTIKIVNTVDKLRKSGELEEADMIMSTRQQEYFVGMQAKGAKDAFSNQSEAIRAINRDPSIDKDEKRQLIDTAYMQMINYARSINKSIEETKKVVKENQAFKEQE